MDYPRLIEKLKQAGYLKTPLIIEAFRAVNRADFMPEEVKDEAGADIPLPIGFGQTISQPLTVAFMFELLQPRPGQKILDIGSGSGWTSALLAHCVGERGKVFAAERIPELCEFGKNNVSKYNFINKGIVEIFCGDASSGLKDKAPFDRILVSAAARTVPEELREQLAPGGRLVIPVKNSVRMLEKGADGQFREEKFEGFSFVPLISDQP